MELPAARSVPPTTVGAPTPQPTVSAPAPRIELPPVQDTPRPVVVASLPPAATPGFELNRISAAQSTPAPAPAAIPPAQVAAQPPVTIVAVPPASSTIAQSQTAVTAAETAPEPENLADAFAEFTSATTARAPAAGAVDITALKVKREVAAPPPPAKAAPPPPPPPPPKPKVPSRVWVQVATGKDLKALAFDWRKFEKKAPALLGKRDAFTAKWGVAQRLLTGPVDSAKTANKLVADLKAAGIDAFVFTSEVGEEVAPLK